MYATSIRRTQNRVNRRHHPILVVNRNLPISTYWGHLDFKSHKTSQKCSLINKYNIQI